MKEKIKVSIVGGSGYAGGELLRLLLSHPKVEIKQVTSERYAGKNVAIVHPNLRSRSELKYTKLENLEECNLLFLGLPNGLALKNIEDYMKLADRVIDISADFRLNDTADYSKWYGFEHPNSDILNKFTYGIAELHREEIKKTKYVACGGCEATVSILSFYPLMQENIIENKEIYIQSLNGSSEGGNKANKSTHHPERAGCYRSYMPVGHRHTAEIIQETGAENVHLSATAVDMIRGILVTGQAKVKDNITERDIRKIYRKHYQDEPFIRIVKERQGIYRYPEPKILQGTNFCDIGFSLDETTRRLVVIGAIDNLVKGTSGQAVQAMNIMLGFNETCGLEFMGLHPV